MFLDPDVKRFTQQTLPTVSMKYLFINILGIWSFFPQKRRTTEHCSSAVHCSSTVAVLTVETSL
jgi:hypothetical protein